MPFALPGQSILTVGGRRVVVGDPTSAAKTYDDFVAHITTLATNGALARNTVFPGVGTAYRVTMGALTGDMVGTSWTAYLSVLNSTPGRAIQHGLPNPAAVSAQITNGFEVFIRLAGEPDQGAPSLDRNGYPSIDGGVTGGDTRMSDLIYWDGTAAQRMNPSAGTGPAPYTW